MTLDPPLLAEKAAAVERHLARVEARLPAEPSEMAPMSDATDAVVLHLFQATQLVLDLAITSCAQLHLGTPTGYGDAFERLAEARVLDAELATRLRRAAGFRDVVAHAYERIDLAIVHRAATDGPADLRAFLRALSRL